MRSRNAAGKVLRFVQETAPDVVCASRSTVRRWPKRAPNTALSRRPYPHRAGGRGAEFEPMVLFSKHPVAGWGATRDGLPEDGIRESLWADIRIKDDTVRVFNNHLHSTAIKAEDNEFITKHRYISGLGARGQDPQHRAPLPRQQHPACGAGRFDCESRGGDLARAHRMRRLQRYAHVLRLSHDGPGLDDAFSSCGRGYSHTFRGFFNALRIDYVLVSDEFEPLTYEVPDVEFSDHLPVVVRMRYRYRH